MFALFSRSLRSAPAAPTRHPHLLIAATSVWLASLCNLPLWQAVAALPAVQGLRGWGFGLAFFVLIAAGNAAVLGLLAWGRLLKPVLALALLTAASGVYFMASYGIVIDTTMLVNVLQTDPREAGDLLNWRMAAALLLLAAPPLLWLMRQRLRPLGWWRQLWQRALFITAAVLVGLASLLLVFQDFAATMRNHTQLRYLINPLNSLYAVFDLATKPLQMDTRTLAPLGRDAQLGTSYQSQATAPLLLLVVGETARAANFGLDGYARATTPQLQARSDIANAPNAWACGTSTAASLPCMFSHLGRSAYGQRKSNAEGLLDVLQHAGLAVLWVDNQSGCKGVCDRVTEISTSALHDPQWCPGGECQDPIMLRDLQAHIDALPAEQRARGTVVVLHQMGSHGPAYAKRSLPAQKKFLPECQTNALQQCTREEVVNAYDNSILATDAFLNASIEWLGQRSGASALLYVSDHGESLGENNLYLHGLPYAIAPDTQKHVPWLAWLSPAMQERTRTATGCLQQDWRTREISHDDYFHSVLGLLDVHTSAYDGTRDVFAPCRQP
ncbi:phosphoethanolamine--lipid A transferase [Acidovorax sp. HDW3]|uniref:phosphoethanolamine transferase n=1 Tax=Acidovorax sp. HDW3 TaxID=2714923 RepID=UPI0014090A77|nr:phosphoethanolamine--lipid A transferase [Acidovorax sp. HDW3]QIL44404.1 phosphoethanolamine--lipid A transferase [Acidovorax sp. HDW3]